MWPYNIDRTSSRDVIQTGRYTTETPGPLPHGKCNISSTRARMDGLARIPICALPLRLEPDAGLDEGTSSLELGQPGQATTTIRILRDLVHNAKANGLTWEQFDWRYARKKRQRKLMKARSPHPSGGISRPFRPFHFVGTTTRHPPSTPPAVPVVSGSPVVDTFLLIVTAIIPAVVPCRPFIFEIPPRGR